jgi:hypothetical protein
MNASDIVKRKNDGVLYSAYYSPTVFVSTSVTCYISTLSSATSTISVTKNVNLYECNGIYNSYELSNSVKQGAYVCGNKGVKQLKFTTLPQVCPHIQFEQGTKFMNDCTLCMDGEKCIDCGDDC